MATQSCSPKRNFSIEGEGLESADHDFRVQEFAPFRKGRAEFLSTSVDVLPAEEPGVDRPRTRPDRCEGKAEGRQHN